MTTDPIPHSELFHHWALDPEVSFLNHGSFGACPRVVLERQAELRARLEAQPVGFFLREYYPLLDEARAELAAFLGARAEGLAFVSNATTGVNCALGSIELAAGDEVLVTDQAYNACRNALDHVAGRSGAVVRVAHLPFPLRSVDELTEAIASAVTDRTRFALIDHVMSPTGMVLPMEDIVRELHARDVELIVDGAHVPGMLPLDLDALGVAYYTGNCHKWMCTPKGSAFLHVREDLREATRPAIISHGANTPTTERPRFRNEFDWVGTMDPTPWLSIPTAIRFFRDLLPGGWDEVRRRNRDLALRAQGILCEHLGIERPVPPEAVGSLAAVPLPDGPAGTPSPLYHDPLQDELWEQHRIEVPIGPWPAPPRRLMRVSAQLYNDEAEYLRLARLLPRT